MPTFFNKPMPTFFTKPIPPRSPLGQDTKQTDERKNQEARALLKLLRGATLASLSEWEAKFLCGMRMQGMSRTYQFSGRQVEKLRDIKDKLLEKGVL